MPPRKLFLPIFAALVVAALAAGIAYYLTRPEPDPEESLAFPASAGAPKAAPPELTFNPQPIGDPVTGRPWITHLTIVDLDQDGLPDVVACDAQTNSIRWLRQAPRGTFTETAVGEPVTGPAHVEPSDLDRDGDLDLLVASMGVVLPSNDPIGSVVVLENLGNGRFQNRVLARDIARVTDVRAGDLDRDGDLDLAVGQFGYAQGEIRWMRNDGDWHFTSRQLLGLSGTIHTPIADFDADGRPDIVALISQEWEEVHLFRNQGDGGFRDAVVWGSTNEDYGSSGLALADLDRDGDTDVFFTNGDAFDYSRPGPRPWHGIQWLENRSGSFNYHRVGNFPGAYSPVCLDLDGDQDNDLVAVSGFNNWENPEAISIMAWINDGHQQFTPVIIAHRPTHLIALAAGDIDGDGRPELVTGGFYAYPPFARMSRVTLWKRP